MDTYRQSILSSARAYAYDDYLAALFSSPQRREDLFCLCAYYGEVARIPLIVKDEILAQIRFQWWRDTLERGVSTGYPVADTLLSLKEERKLPLELLLSLIEQREAELDLSFLSDPQTLRDYVKTLDVSYFKLRALLLECPLQEKSTGLLLEVAPLLGALRFCLRLPSLFARWQRDKGMSLNTTIQNRSLELNENLFLEERISLLISQIAADYDHARPQLKALHGNERSVFLPLALGRSYLKILQLCRRDASLLRRAPLPLSRFLSLFFAAKFGRF
ncbi:MAG: squalene/phytoene synthase family protein [Hyphomicrobium sp.]